MEFSSEVAIHIFLDEQESSQISPRKKTSYKDKTLFQGILEKEMTKDSSEKDVLNLEDMFGEEVADHSKETYFENPLTSEKSVNVNKVSKRRLRFLSLFPGEEITKKEASKEIKYPSQESFKVEQDQLPKPNRRRSPIDNPSNQESQCENATKVPPSLGLFRRISFIFGFKSGDSKTLEVNRGNSYKTANPNTRRKSTITKTNSGQKNGFFSGIKRNSM